MSEYSIVIDEKTIVERKGQWFTLLSLSSEHLNRHPADIKLIGKQFKILNRVFMVETKTGAINMFLYGAKCQFKTQKELFTEKIAVKTNVIL